MADPVATPVSTPTPEQEVAALPNARTYSVDQQLIPWEEDPSAASRGEALALLTTLEELRNEGRIFNNTVGPIRDQIQARRATIVQIRQVIAAHKQPGMAGVGLDLGMSGSLSKAFKRITRSVKDVTQDVTKALDNALKSIDKATFRKIGDELEEAGVRDFLRKIEKYTLRPAGDQVEKAAKEVRKGMQILDKYVPGWTVLVNFIVPIPGLSMLLSAASGSLLSGEILAKLAPSFVDSLPGSFADAGIKAAAEAARPITVPATQLVAPGTFANQAVTQFPFTVAKLTDTYIRTDGAFRDKLLAVANEALNEMSLALSIATIVATGGASAVALQVINAAFQSLKAGITFLKAYDAAKELKKQARQYQQDGLAQIAALEAEEAAARAELEALRGQIAQINAERARLAEVQRQIAAVKAKQAAEAAAAAAKKKAADEAARIAGLNQGAINRNRLLFAGALGFFFLGTAVLLTEDEGD